MNLPHFYSVEDFMDVMVKFMDKNCTEEEKECEKPSRKTVERAFLISNPYQGVTPSTMRLNAVRVISQRQVHKSHIDEHACNVLRRITKDRVHLLAKIICLLTRKYLQQLDYYSKISDGEYANIV